MVNSPSFPRRRESCFELTQWIVLHEFLNIRQDSRLHGNDGISCFSFATPLRYAGCLILFDYLAAVCGAQAMFNKLAAGVSGSAVS